MGYRPGLPWQMFLKHAAPLFVPGMTVLEIGPGRISRALPRAFCHERGCPYSFCDRLNYNEDNPEFVPMPEDYRIAAEDETWDAVVMYEMLHNVRHPWRLLPEVARLIKRGGFAVVEDVTAYPEFNRHPVDFGRIFPDGMTALWEEAGMTPIVGVVGKADDLAMPARGKFDVGQIMHMVSIARKP